MWADLKMLWSLWKGRRENPLLAYYDPRRRNVAGWAFRLGEFFCFVSMTYLGMSLWFGSGSSTDAFWSAALTPVVLALILPTVFLFVAPGPWSRERSIDLRLSGLTSQEIAFGFLFWPMVLVVIVGVGAGSFLVAELGDLREWRVARFSPRMVALMITGLLMSLSVGALTLERWYRNSAWRWTALFLTPLKLLPAVLMMAAMAELMEVWLGNPSAPTVLVLVGGLWTATRLQLALTAAGWRILGVSACAEELLRNHWRSRERALLKLPGKGRVARFEFVRRAWPSIMVLNLIVVGLALAAGWMGNNMAETGLTMNEQYHGENAVRNRIAAVTIEFGLLSLPLATALAVWIASVWRGGRVPMLSGGLHFGCVVYCAPAFLVLLMPLMSMATVPFPDAFRDQGYWMLVGVLAIGLGLILGCSFLLLIPKRRRWLVTIGLVGLSLLSLARIGDFSKITFAPFDSDVVLFAVGVMALLFLEWALARVYRLELRDVPLGRLNTDSYEGEPLAPEALLDELAAKG